MWYRNTGLWCGPTALLQSPAESGVGFRPKTVARRPGRNGHRLPLPPKRRFQSGWLGGAWHWVGASGHRHCCRAETDAGLH